MIRIPFLLLVASALGFASGAGAAEREAWNQAAVAELAKQLAGATEGLEDGADRKHGFHEESPEEVAHYRMLDHLRILEQESQVLAKRLAAGKGRGRTLEIFSHIDRTDATLQAEAGKAPPPSATQETLGKMRAILTKMRGYYIAPEKPLEAAP